MSNEELRAAKWRCYVCGEPIGEQFTLFSLSVETDRVFLAHEKCQTRLDSEAILFGVRREVAANPSAAPSGTALSRDQVCSAYWDSMSAHDVPLSQRGDLFQKMADKLNTLLAAAQPPLRGGSGELTGGDFETFVKRILRNAPFKVNDADLLGRYIFIARESYEYAAGRKAGQEREG